MYYQRHGAYSATRWGLLDFALVLKVSGVYFVGSCDSLGGQCFFIYGGPCLRTFVNYTAVSWGVCWIFAHKLLHLNFVCSYTANGSRLLWVASFARDCISLLLLVKHRFWQYEHLHLETTGWFTGRLCRRVDCYSQVSWHSLLIHILHSPLATYRMQYRCYELCSDERVIRLIILEAYGATKRHKSIKLIHTRFSRLRKYWKLHTQRC